MSTDGFEFAQTIRGITERVAHEMGDAETGSEFEGLDQNWIRARVFDTFKWLQGRRPDLFASEETFELAKGEKQKLPPECDRLIEVLSVHIDGKDYPVFESSYKAMRSAQAYSKLAPACPESCVFHAATLDSDPTRFLFSPALTQTVQVTVNCTNMSQYFTDMDKELECDAAKWINTVVEYVLYLAHSSDSSNQASASLADQHRATFFDLAPVQRREQPN